MKDNKQQTSIRLLLKAILDEYNASSMNYKTYLRIIFLLFILLIAIKSNAQTVIVLEHGKPSSLRGLSVVDDSIAWVSGSHGYIAETLNGGKTWNWMQVKGYEKADFRDIEAFSDKEAIIMSSGTPALILKTADGGNSWQLKYKNIDSIYFFDAMNFVDRQHGLILGDPIKNKFLLMETTDGGETWAHFKNEPMALKGEACFAASGTCLRTSDKMLYIASGGTAARLISCSFANEVWKYTDLPITHGKSTTGAFSLAFNKKTGIITGGNYANDKARDSLIASIASFSANTEKLVNNIASYPSGFQSCIEFIRDQIFLSTGTPGSNVTTDGGKTWKQIDDASYNVCHKAKHGILVLLAGNNGSIAVLRQ